MAKNQISLYIKELWHKESNGNHQSTPNPKYEGKSLNNRNFILKCMEKYAQWKILFRDTKWLLSNMPYRGRDDRAVWACALARYNMAAPLSTCTVEEQRSVVRFDVNTSLKSVPVTPHVRKLRASRNQFQFVLQNFPWCRRSIRVFLISLYRARMKVCCAQWQWRHFPRPFLRRR